LSISTVHGGAGGGEGGGGCSDGGEVSGDGGEGGDGGGEGGDGGEVGGDGGGGEGGGEDGDWNCTTKDVAPSLPYAREKVCLKPGADHSAPFQPSPQESVMSRVHVAPSATANGTLEVYGAPPLSVVPSEQLRLQPTSPAYLPLEQAIVEDIVGVAGGSGGGDGGDGGDGGGGGGGGGTGQAVWQTYFRSRAHPTSFHLPLMRKLNSKQSSPPPLGSPGYQLVYDSGVLDGLHTHVPSDAASVPPIHTLLPAAAVISCSFCAVDCTVASCRPAFWQSASAPAHGRALFMSV